MRRANFWGNLLSGIASSTLGLILLLQLFGGANNWSAYMLGIYLTLCYGYGRIWETTQTLEISDSGLIYQSVWKIVRLRWDEIGGYILNDERFVAYDKNERRVLLDIGLRGSDYLDWPPGECLQTRKFIQGKMDEVGAARISSLSLNKDYGFQFKP